MAHTTPYTPEVALDHRGRSSWGAILAGGITALALTLLLTLLGMALGFTSFNPATEDNPLGNLPTISLVWMAVTTIIAVGVGGYTAGRLAGVLHNTGAALHGVTVWAVYTLLAVWLGSTALTGLVNLTGSALSQMYSAMSSATQAVMPEDFDMPDITSVSVDMNDLPEPLQTELRQAGITPDNFQSEVREAFRNVISQQEQRQAVNITGQTASNIVQNPSNAPEEINDMVNAMFGQGGVLSQEDRQQALQVMQQRFGVSRSDAEQLMQEIEQTVERYQTQAQQAFETAQQQATQLAGEASDTIATTAWTAFIASVLGLVAAIGGAVAGRPKVV
jgi:ElaB/YqjD/DUF883 family membrane-anchored ribosome-binding protein